MENQIIDVEAIVPAEQQAALTAKTAENFVDGFRECYKLAQTLCQAAIIPSQYHGKPADVAIAVDMASRMGVSPMMVMQNLYVVQGKPSWSGQACKAFIGQKYKGTLGAIVTTLGVVFPSLVIISLLAGVIEAFSHLVWVQDAFAAIRVCVCVLIFNAVVKLWKSAVKDRWALGIFLCVLAASLLLDLSPVVFVLFAAVAGILIKVLGGAKA